MEPCLLENEIPCMCNVSDCSGCWSSSGCWSDDSVSDTFIDLTMDAKLMHNTRADTGESISDLGISKLHIKHQELTIANIKIHDKQHHATFKEPNKTNMSYTDLGDGDNCHNNNDAYHPRYDAGSNNSDDQGDDENENHNGSEGYSDSSCPTTELYNDSDMCTRKNTSNIYLLSPTIQNQNLECSNSHISFVENANNKEPHIQTATRPFSDKAFRVNTFSWTSSNRHTPYKCVMVIICTWFLLMMSLIPIFYVGWKTGTQITTYYIYDYIIMPKLTYVSDFIKKII
jgi:hypothetical protein